MNVSLILEKSQQAVKTATKKVVSFCSKTKINNGPSCDTTIISNEGKKIAEIAQKFGVDSHLIPENIQEEVQKLSEIYKNVKNEKLEELFIMKYFDRFAQDTKNPKREIYEQAILKNGVKYIKLEDILNHTKKEIKSITELNPEDLINDEIKRIVTKTFKKANKYPEEISKELRRQKENFFRKPEIKSFPDKELSLA